MYIVYQCVCVLFMYVYVCVVCICVVNMCVCVLFMCMYVCIVCMCVLFMSVYVCVCVCECVCVDRRTTCEIRYLLLPYGIQGLNSNRQTWYQAPFPAKHLPDPRLRLYLEINSQIPRW